MSPGVWNLLKQQRLPAWQPILTSPLVALGFVLLTAIFVPIGSVILASNRHATEISFRYDHINQCTASHNTGAFVYSGNGDTIRTGCLTRVTFDITETLQAPIYLYYGLTNFYQNHRRYASSRNDAQLAGAEVKTSDLSDASPLVQPGAVARMAGVPIQYRGANLRYEDFVYVPAGLIPWSMFNDTFVLYRVTGDSESNATLVCNGTDFARNSNLPLKGSVSPNQCRKRGIAWASDVSKKFKPPSASALMHPTWTAPRELYSETPLTEPVSNDSYLNNGWYAGELGHAVPVTTDEDLMVWMRSASLPNFRKLYRVIETDLPPGRYLMEIGEHYDAVSFGGTKAFTLARLSWLGGRNTFLGVLYVVVGGIALVFAALLVVLHQLGGDRASEAIDDLMRR